MERLTDLYKQSDRVRKITEHISSEQSTRLRVSGTIGSQLCFILAAAAQSTSQSHLYIARDKEEAAYFQNSLQNIQEEQSIHFFPDSFKRPTFFEEINGNHILQRTEAVNKINNKEGKGEIVVTYPEALFEKVVDPQLLEKEKIIISVGENIDVDTAIELLVEYGFERVDFVYEPGQFSIRGGIIDIFSFGNEWPYRIELFDLEVETIRTFDPSTQLSIKQIRKVSIIPNIKSKFKQEEKVSIFSVFRDQAVIWIEDVDFLLDRLQSCFEKAKDFHKTMTFKENEEIARILDDRAFIYPKDVMEDIGKMDVILMSEGKMKIEVEEVISFQARAQPPFNKNFTLLIEDLNKTKEGGI